MGASSVQASDRHLRVAWLWNGTLQGEETLEAPVPVILGEGASALFPLPEGALPDDDVTLLEPAGRGYALRVSNHIGGSVWRGGTRSDLSSLGAGTQVSLGPDDYGVVTVGSIAVFFQHVRAAKKPTRRMFALDPALAACIGLSAFLFAAFLLIAFLDLRINGQAPDPLELPADLVAKYMVVPPPQDLLRQQRGTNKQDPGLRHRDEAGGKKAAGNEGRVGRHDAQREDSQIAGQRTDAVAVKVRSMGLLGALSNGGSGNAIAQALDVPQVSDLIGGLGATTTVLGRGSGGAGLRGVGGGGGGTGPGNLFGAGNLGTGVGAGHGNGTGHGRHGIGVPGRERHEVQINVSRGTPRVNGYLSPDQINRVVRANQAAIRYCYQVEVQREPHLRGKIEINWRINLQGAVTTARVASSTMHNARVEGCLVRQVRNWHFPHPDGGEVVVTYPFIFGLQGG